MKILSGEEYSRLILSEAKLKNQRKESRSKEKALNNLIEDQGEIIDDLRDDVESLTKLKNDSLAVKTLTLELEEKEKLLESREKVLVAKSEVIEMDENAYYKNGYQDGVADGLRKAYEITAEDRKQMASIAALAAASHSNGATETLTNEIVKGMNRALPAKTTSKS